MIDSDVVISATRQWIQSIVIGLNLCPFARKVFDAGRIRFAVTEASDPETLRTALAEELRRLISTPRADIETTILIHPNVLTDFLDYNDFLSDADRLLEELDLIGVIQIASFHPGYQFAGTDPDDVENWSNRSPYPMLHLLREESVTEVAGDTEAIEEIPVRNVATLRRLGRDGIARLFRPPE